MLNKAILVGKLVAAIFRQIYTRLHLVLSQPLHRLTYKSTDHPRNVVIIGASFAGYHTARCLAHSLPTGYRVVVIERHTHFHLTWVLPRFSVVPGHDHKAFIPYGSYLSKAPRGSYLWMTDTVQRIIPGDGGKTGRVELESGASVDYEYLVIATGSSSGLPSRVPAMDKKNGMELLHVEQHKLRAATDIVIVGGGAAGVELAGDAKARYPEKNVTLVHSRRQLLSNGYGPKIRERALTELVFLGVDVELGQRVLVKDIEKSQSVQLDSGTSIACDCLVQCTGQRPNSSLIQSISPASISTSGHIKVRPTLQIADDSFSQIYAAGDAIDVEGVRNARGAMEQAQVVAKNIVRAMVSRTQMEYYPQWWEGVTKLTVGLTKSVVWMGDGSAEIIVPIKSTREELDSAGVWKFFGLRPYQNQSMLHLG